MPIPGIEQPELITIDEGLRLRKFDGDYDCALPWYQDAETLLLVDGKADPYTPLRIRAMYDLALEHQPGWSVGYKGKRLKSAPFKGSTADFIE